MVLSQLLFTLMRTSRCINATCSLLRIAFGGSLINQCFMQAKPLKLMWAKSALSSPAAPKPLQCSLLLFLKKEEKEINRDSSCIILGKISTLSTAGVISWKAERRRARGWGGGRKRKKVTGKPRSEDLLGVSTVLLKKNISKLTLACSPWCPQVLEMPHSAVGEFRLELEENPPSLAVKQKGLLFSKGDLGPKWQSQPRLGSAKHCCLTPWLRVASPGCEISVGTQGDIQATPQQCRKIQQQSASCEWQIEGRTGRDRNAPNSVWGAHSELFPSLGLNSHRSCRERQPQCEKEGETTWNRCFKTLAFIFFKSCSALVHNSKLHRKC